jgi:hypothetical protein
MKKLYGTVALLCSVILLLNPVFLGFSVTNFGVILILGLIIGGTALLLV